MPADDYDYRLTPPRRRRTLVRMSIIGVAVLLSALVALMLKGPGPDTVARRILDASLAELPAGLLSIDDMTQMKTALAEASRAAPKSAYPDEVREAFRQRIESELYKLIEARDLARAETHLSFGKALWPGRDAFSRDGRPASLLDTARLVQEANDSIKALTAELTTLDPSGPLSRQLMASLADGFDKLDRLPATSEVKQDMAVAQEGLLNALAAVVRSRLDRDDPRGADVLLELAIKGREQIDAALPNSAALDTTFETLSREARLAKLIEQGGQRLASDRLTQPANDSAAYYFEEALRIEPSSTRAQSGLAAIAERYERMAMNSLDEGDMESTGLYLARLQAFSPEHPGIAPLKKRLTDAVASASRATLEVSRKQSAPGASGIPSDGISSDAEGSLWREVMNDCRGNQLQRYIDSYPSGRYVEEAWRRRSRCLGQGR